MDIVPEANRPELFELLFQTIDFFPSGDRSYRKWATPY